MSESLGQYSFTVWGDTFGLEDARAVLFNRRSFRYDIRFIPHLPSYPTDNAFTLEHLATTVTSDKRSLKATLIQAPESLDEIPARMSRLGERAWPKFCCEHRRSLRTVAKPVFAAAKGGGGWP